MAWDPVWERVFTRQAWGKYPGEDLIRFVARNFYGVPDRAAVRILEVGSGTGTNLWFIAREGFAAFGIEGSPTAVRIARERLDAECAGWDAAPRRGEIRTGDMARLPWPDGQFDAVIDSEAVYCNDDVESRAIYREMHRVTRPGGRLFVRTFAIGTWGDGTGEQLAARRWVAGAGPLAGKGPSRFTTLEELPELLGPWHILETNLITRTLDSRREAVREWIVEGAKS
jgi:SAM-dependent methyltransferase